MIRNGEKGTPDLGLTQARFGEISDRHEARFDSSAGLLIFFFSSFFLALAVLLFIYVSFFFGCALVNPPGQELCVAMNKMPSRELKQKASERLLPP